MGRFSALALAILVLAGPACAQDADCTGFKWSLDRELTAFRNEGSPTVASGTPLPGLVEPARLQLLPQEQVTYPVPPAHKPRHTPGFGGSFPVPPIAAADTYQVTLSGDAWIDVVQNGKTLRQVGFTGSHSCKAVRKSVRFVLAAGPATVEISDAEADSLMIEVLPKEH